jgi:hypothetical protein
MIWFDVVRAFVFAVVYGFMENRVFFEGDMDYSILNHFKLYHLCMLVLFAVAGFSFSLPTLIFNLVLMPAVQDASWYVFEGREPRRDDWTNWGGFPLILGLPWHYWMCASVLICLGLIFR